MANILCSRSKRGILLLFMGTLWAVSCGPSDSGSSALSSDNPPPASPSDPLQSVRVEIADKMSHYYEDLSEGQIQASDYYAPNVERFFNSRNLPVENIEKSLQNSIAQNPNRDLLLDPSSVEVEQVGSDYLVTLSGTARILDENGLVTQEDRFQNQIRLNEALQIIAYESLPSDQQARKIAPDNRSAALLASRLLPALQEGAWGAVSDCIYPEYGFYLITKPGVMPYPKLLQQLTQLPTEVPAMKNGWTNLSRQAVEGALPDFDCENQFSKTGAFFTLLEEPYRGVSELMEMENENKRQYDEENLTQTREMENHISYELVDSQSGATFYFGEIKGKWYLLVLDLSLYDCSA